MAELHVQPKKNKLWWLWILIVLVILALVYFYFKGNSNQMATLKVIPKNQITNKVCAFVRVHRGRQTIYSRAIVRYISDPKMVPIKVYYL